MRRDIDERKEEIIAWLESGVPQVECARRLECKIDTLRTRLRNWDVSHLNKMSGRGTRKNMPHKVDITSYLNNERPIKSHLLKLRLIAEEIKSPCCEKCGWKKWSIDGRLPLELDHIDGNHWNNNLDNLQILCPNCHALKAPNRPKETSNRRTDQYLLDQVKKVYQKQYGPVAEQADASALGADGGNTV